jgi:plasmid stabilization system protein ParE
MYTNYYLSPIAEQDIDEIVTYLAQENFTAAHLFLDSLYTAMENLAKYPDIGHLREDLTDKSVKFWTFKWHYLIIYTPQTPIEIVRVLSGYRDLISLIG